MSIPSARTRLRSPTKPTPPSRTRKSGWCSTRRTRGTSEPCRRRTCSGGSGSTSRQQRIDLPHLVRGESRVDPQPRRGGRVVSEGADAGLRGEEEGGVDGHRGAEVTARVGGGGSGQEVLPWDLLPAWGMSAMRPRTLPLIHFSVLIWLLLLLMLVLLSFRERKMLQEKLLFPRVTVLLSNSPSSLILISGFLLLYNVD